MVRIAEPLALLALIAVGGLLARGGRRALGRALTAFLLVLALSEPEVTWRREGAAVFFLVDLSASTGGEAELRLGELLPALRGREVEVGIIGFGKEPVLLVPPAEGVTGAPRWTPGVVDPGGTDVAAAVDLALGLLPPGAPAQLVLITDGRATEGDPTAALVRARARDVGMVFVPVGTGDPLVLRRLVGPGEMPPGRARFTATVSCARGLTATAIWSLEGEELRREELRLAPGEHRVSLEIELPEPGVYALSLTLSVPGDPFPENNALTVPVRVGAVPEVLVVSRRESAVEGLLSGAGIRYRRVPFLTEFDLAGAELIVLDDYPLGLISPGILARLRAFVEAGGGIVALLGREAVAGYLGPVEELLPVAFEAPQEIREPTAALVFVLDKSASMAGRAEGIRKIDILKEAVAAAAEAVAADDLLGALAFDRAAYWLVRPAPAREVQETLYRGLSALEPSGGTDLYPAVSAALAALRGIHTRIRHVIIVSDGKTIRVGDFPALYREIEREGVGVTCIAIGADPDLEILGGLVRAGDGDLILVRDLKGLTRVLVRETQRALRPRFLRGEFPLVTGDAPEAREIPVPPPLFGYTLTFAKPHAEVILASDEGDPVLAYRRVGLGTVVALNTDLSGIWSRNWLSWDGLGELFGAMLARAWPARGPVHVSWEESEGMLRLAVEVAEGGRWVNGLSLVGRLVGGGGETEVEFRQRAPGRYEAEVRAPPAGAYSLFVHDVSGRYGGSFAIPLPYPREYAATGPDREALRTWAEVTGGAVVEDEVLPAIPARGWRWIPLRRVLLLLSGLSLILDLAGRRFRGR